MSGSISVELSVVSPALNEAETIAEVVSEWMEILAAAEIEWEIIVIDDGSTDDTGSEVMSIKDPRVSLLRIDENIGYAGAMTRGIEQAKGKYVTTIDSDNQFDLKDALTLLEKLKNENLDLVTGYRRKKSDSVLRVIADRMLNLIVRVMFGLSFKDTNCALKVMTAEVARGLSLEVKNFPTPTEVMVRVSRNGCKTGEAPVDHRARSGGASKLSIMTGSVHFSLFLLYLRLQLWLIDWGVIQRMNR